MVTKDILGGGSKVKIRPMFNPKIENEIMRYIYIWFRNITQLLFFEKIQIFISSARVVYQSIYVKISK